MQPVVELLKRPEGKTLEFKRDLSSPQKIIRTIIAFANTAGGTILIGVSDIRRQVVGVENPLDAEEKLCSLIADHIQPKLLPHIEIIAYKKRNLLLVEVFPSQLRPHFLKSKGEAGGVFVRLGSTNREADTQLVQELKRTAAGLTFDQQLMPECGKGELDIEEIKRRFDGIRKISQNDLTTFKLLVRDQKKFTPTIGGILLFGKNREQHFTDAWVQCGRFTGNNKSEIFDHIELYEHLPEAVESIMLFLKKHANRGADSVGIRRRDVWSIPLKILREAVINALVHTDYSQLGGPIRIAFFDDRIEIENPGILLPGLTVEDMKQGVSKIRNPVIARVFRELDLIEQWGSGVPKMFEEAKRLGLPSPEIIEVGMRVRLIVPLGVSIAVQAATKQIPSGVESGVESAMAVEILNFLTEKACSKSEIAKKLGKTRPNRYLNELMTTLLHSGFVEYTVPDKPNSRLQKYRLTVKGQEHRKKGMRKR